MRHRPRADGSRSSPRGRLLAVRRVQSVAATLRVGDVSQPKPIRITNVGSGDLDVSLAPSIRGFLWNGLNTVLPPGNAVTVDVEFAPQGPGLQSRALAVQSNAPGSPHPVALTGSGTTEQDRL